MAASLQSRYLGINTWGEEPVGQVEYDAILSGGIDDTAITFYEKDGVAWLMRTDPITGLVTTNHKSSFTDSQVYAPRYVAAGSPTIEPPPYMTYWLNPDLVP